MNSLPYVLKILGNITVAQPGTCNSAQSETVLSDTTQTQTTTPSQVGGFLHYVKGSNETANNTIVITKEVIANIIALARSGNNANIPAEYRRNMIAVIEMEATKKNFTKEYTILLIEAINSVEPELKIQLTEVPHAQGNVAEYFASMEGKKSVSWNSSKYCLIYGVVLASVTGAILNGPSIAGAVTGAVMAAGDYVQEKFGDEITGKLGSTFLSYAVASDETSGTESGGFLANALANMFKE